MKRTVRIGIAVMMVVGFSRSGYTQGQAVELVLKGKASAGGIPVHIVPPEGGAPVPAGTTSADGTLTLDSLLGGLPPGKPVKVTVRDCKGRPREVFIGAVPPKKEDCDDDVIGGFLWRGGRHELALDGGGHRGRNAAIGGAGALLLIGATQIGAGDSSATPAVVMPGNTNTNTGTATTPAAPAAPATPATPACVSQSGTTNATLSQDGCGGFRGFTADVQQTCGSDNSVMLTFRDQIPRSVAGPRGTALNLSGSGPFPLAGVSRYEATFMGTRDGDVITGQELLRLIATNGTSCVVVFGHVIRLLP